jgi:hypothetical protein
LKETNNLELPLVGMHEQAKTVQGQARSRQQGLHLGRYGRARRLTLGCGERRDATERRAQDEGAAADMT